MTGPDVVVAGIVEAQSSLDPLTAWQLRPATVQVADEISPMIMFDGEGFQGTATVQVPAISLVGAVALGDRVMVMTVPPNGNYILSLVNSYPRTIAWTERDTQSTPAAGSQPVLRIDGVPLRTGHRYQIKTSNFLMFSTVSATTSASARLSAETGGSQATTASPLLTIWNTSLIPTANDGVGAKLDVSLSNLFDTTLSVLLFTERVTGGGNVSIFASGVVPLQLEVIDLGPQPVDTGVDL